MAGHRRASGQGLLPGPGDRRPGAQPRPAAAPSGDAEPGRVGRFAARNRRPGDHGRRPGRRPAGCRRTAPRGRSDRAGPDQAQCRTPEPRCWPAASTPRSTRRMHSATRTGRPRCRPSTGGPSASSGGADQVALQLVDIDLIRDAAELIRPYAVRTPLLASPWPGLWLKPENLQPIGAFKIRGAVTAISRLDPAVRARGRARALVRQPRPGGRLRGRASSASTPTS